LCYALATKIPACRGGCRLRRRPRSGRHRVGGGIEHALRPNSFVKAQYRYSSYERDVEEHRVIGGFGFRF
jgi:outer membrane immunogenic protein